MRCTEAILGKKQLGLAHTRRAAERGQPEMAK
jgi:hypothetical protein